jgi:hypothetical protein
LAVLGSADLNALSVTNSCLSVSGPLRHACRIADMHSVHPRCLQFESFLYPNSPQREGIALAKKAGKYKGRKRALTAEQVQDIRKRVGAGERKARLAAEYRVSRQTLYSSIAGAGVAHVR